MDIGLSLFFQRRRLLVISEAYFQIGIVIFHNRKRTPLKLSLSIFIEQVSRESVVQSDDGLAEKETDFLSMGVVPLHNKPSLRLFGKQGEYHHRNLLTWRVHFSVSTLLHQETTHIPALRT